MPIVLWLKNSRSVQVFLDQGFRSQPANERNSFYDQVIVAIHGSEGVLKQLHQIFREHTSVRDLFKLLLCLQFFCLVGLSNSIKHPHQSFVHSKQIAIFARLAHDTFGYFFWSCIQYFQDFRVVVHVLNEGNFFNLSVFISFANNISEYLFDQLLFITTFFGITSAFIQLRKTTLFKLAGH